MCSRIYEVIHAREGRNNRELTVQKGELLEVSHLTVTGSKLSYWRQEAILQLLEVSNLTVPVVGDKPLRIIGGKPLKSYWR